LNRTNRSIALPFYAANLSFRAKFRGTTERSAGARVEPRTKELVMANESGSRPSIKRSRTHEEMSSEIDDLQSEIQNLASRVSSTAASKIRSTQEGVEATIRDNPIASVAIAAAAGFLYAIIRR
jgi:ElaB/YqjD/DUF883 family membrane-anchored ribosome-binding protein